MISNFRNETNRKKVKKRKKLKYYIIDVNSIDPFRYKKMLEDPETGVIYLSKEKQVIGKVVNGKTLRVSPAVPITDFLKVTAPQVINKANKTRMSAEDIYSSIYVKQLNLSVARVLRKNI